MSLAYGLVQDVWWQITRAQVVVLILTGAVDEPVGDLGDQGMIWLACLGSGK